MSSHKAPDGYITISNIYNILIATKDHFEASDILFAALVNKKVRAHYIDPNGNRRDLSSNYWNGLRYNRTPSLGFPVNAWKTACETGEAPVEDPRSKAVTKVVIVLPNPAINVILNEPVGDRSASEPVGDFLVSGQEKSEIVSTPSKKPGAPKTRDELAFVAIAATLWAIKREYAKGTRAQWRRDTIEVYAKFCSTDRAPDKTPSDSYATPLLDQIEELLSRLHDAEDKGELDPLLK